MKKAWPFLPALPGLLVLLAAVVAAAPEAGDRGPDGSLEELIREVRRRREAQVAKLAQPVGELLQRLDAVAVDDEGGVRGIQEELIALGVEAAPLLVPRIDPGAASGGPEKRLARRLVPVLEALPTRAVTGALVRMVSEGSRSGRLNAMVVLASSPDHARASEALVEAYRGSTGELREQALCSIAQLGGAANEEVLVEALRETDPESLRAVLVALTETASPAGRAGVRDLAGAPNTAASLVGEILAYYRALARGPGVQDEDVAALVRLAAHEAPSKEDRLAVLDTIPRLVSGLDSRTKRHFNPLLSAAEDEIREAAEICLAILGDRNARRDVIKRYNDLVAQNDAWAGAYEQRAAVLLKLREYDDAARDFQRAIKVYTDMGRSSQLDALYVDLARTYARDGSVKRAYDALEKGNLPLGVLRKLKDDPDFAEIAKHSRYGRIFDL